MLLFTWRDTPTFSHNKTSQLNKQASGTELARLMHANWSLTQSIWYHMLLLWIRTKVLQVNQRDDHLKTQKSIQTFIIVSKLLLPRS